MKFAVFTVAAALFTAAVPAQAQQQPQQRPEARAERGAQRDPAQRIERRVQMLDQGLDLNDNQVARIRTILTKEAEQMQAHFAQRGERPARVRGDSAQSGRDRAAGAPQGQRRERNDAARDSVRAQMKQIHDRTEQEILQVLNAQQREKYQQLRQEFEGRRGGRGSERGGKPRGDVRAS